MPGQPAGATCVPRAKRNHVDSGPSQRRRGFWRRTALAAAARCSSAGCIAAVRGSWPLVLLLAALATLFPAFIDAGPLHRPVQPTDHYSYHHLAVAKNLSPRQALLGFYSRTVTDDGQPALELYNRFPPLGYVLIRLAIATQGGDLAGEIQAARMLMLALFAGAALLAYLAVAQLTERPWVALAATLATFSSYTALRTCDVIATEIAVDLFGTMLVFHGIARYLSPAGPKHRLGQLLAKTCIALLLGWHVVGLLAPFVVLGLAAACVRRDWTECRRLMLFASFASLFALAVLAQNFAKEYLALHGHTSLWDLPSFRSMEYKFTLKTGIADHWPAFLRHELQLIGLALAPYAATQGHIDWVGWSLLGGLGGGVLAVAAGVALSGRQARRAAAGQRQAASLALLSVAAAGPCWAAVMRGTHESYREWTWDTLATMPTSPFDQHDVSEAVFLVGVPLAVFALAALLASAFGWRTASPRSRAVAAAIVATLWLAFVASTFQMGRLSHDPNYEERELALYEDVAAIRRLAAGKRIFAPGPIWLESPYMFFARKRYYFTGSVLILDSVHAGLAEFVAGPRLPQVETLTPDNQFYFLYPIAAFFDVCAKPAPPGTADAAELTRWCRNG